MGKGDRWRAQWQDGYENHGRSATALLDDMARSMWVGDTTAESKRLLSERAFRLLGFIVDEGLPDEEFVRQFADSGLVTLIAPERPSR